MNSTDEKCLNMTIGERWVDTNRAGEKTYVIQGVNPDTKLVDIKLDHDIEHWTAGAVVTLPFASFRDDYKVEDAPSEGNESANVHIDDLLSRQKLVDIKVVTLPFASFRDDYKVEDAPSEGDEPSDNEYVDELLNRQRLEVESIDNLIEETMADYHSLAKRIERLRSARTLAVTMLEACEKHKESN
jgi:hypothetical protein